MLDVAVTALAPWPDAWEEDGVLAAAAEAALAATRYGDIIAAPGQVEVSIRLTDDDEVQALNAQWRGKDKPTNVLSFPQLEPDELDQALASPGEELLLGDIVLAHQTCAREAADKQISVTAHATHLVVHGTLHLLGYDHIDDEEALVMEALERQILAGLGHADPYAADGVD